MYAVQLAVARGANVTAIGGRHSEARLKELGATTAHSYHDASFEDLIGTFDTVLDLSGTLRYSRVRRKLTERGAFVRVNPQKDLVCMITSRVGERTMPFAYVPHPSAPTQAHVLELVAGGVIRSAVETAYGISEFRAAFDGLLRNERFGKTVLSY
ncbi:zinc-binding dehydrogenase [Streptomyces fuscichromogenes]|uniref:zinc-binding dehydrogenase n=1 Tax=Streptomyces fuscichromogenes TaxID=1324013 RepID=UPI00380F65BE